MGKAIKVVLGDVEFRTMDLARQHFSAMLWSYKIGDIVSPDHSRLLSELLKRHPEADIKVGVGLKNFEVIDDKQGSQCFAVRRIDDSFEDFSYKSCITEGRYK
ncbi:DCL family protein [Xanthomonas sp. CFBP 8703]|uniref:DCL family protein n=1 Tax=Xanthomonas bonasiae TaxID=2810351 RepID=A0ABS3B4K4_9XANT|nr:DCL family protein [Xanthomonas bonasiae]MBN6103492.1 DCL family protein [Xanthomonas bonasiae]